MSDLISREKLLDYLQMIPIDLGYREVESIRTFVKHMPPAQEWIPVKYRPMTAEERKRFEEEYTYGYELEDKEHIHTCRVEVRIEYDEVIVTERCVECGEKIHEVRIKGARVI